jgi:nucleoside-diphosphate-sugar epimerase
MVVLVTGGSGYIGSLLIRVLPFERGFEGEVVRILDNMAGDKYSSLFDLPEGARYEFLLGDLTKPEDLRRALVDVDLVFDLAGITSVPLSYKMSEETKRVNVEGARNLLEVAVSCGARSA